jgi:small subunit ribosomal protein S3
VSSIEVDRPGNKLRITIHTSRPGIIIGRKGAEIEKLKGELNKKTGREVFIDIQEVHKPELDAQLVSESIALQLEKRVAFRRAMRKSVDSALRFGCKGIKVRVSGRLNGAEIARTEWYLQGRLPLHTLRADIDYGFSQAYTTYGVIGVKCWIYKGEILPGQMRRGLRNDPEPRRGPRRERGSRQMAGPAPTNMPVPEGGMPGSGPGAGTPLSAPLSAPPTGPVVQPPPGDMPSRTTILPPMASPSQQPGWKQPSPEEESGTSAATPDSGTGTGEEPKPE